MVTAVPLSLVLPLGQKMLQSSVRQSSRSMPRRYIPTEMTKQCLHSAVKRNSERQRAELFKETIHLVFDGGF